MAQAITLSSALNDLSTARTRGFRDSNEIVRKGLFVLEQKNGLQQLGDSVWDFLEQLTIAALDIGQLDLADDCIHRLDEQFPKSMRVEKLRGMRIEAQDLGLALQFYEQALEKDEVNVDLWKRLISVLRQQNKIERCIAELDSFLDTFYSDVEGWLELADIYASQSLYTRSQQALSHVLLLAPQNPFHTLRFAETAYSANDVPLALRYFLRTVELTTDDESSTPSTGAARRAWFGVRLCIKHLLSNPGAPSESNTPPMKKENLESLDILAAERLTAAYSSTSSKTSIPGRTEVLKWLSG